MSLVQDLIAFGKQHCLGNTETEHIRDIRIGLGYTIVELSDGASGVAWTPDRSPSSSCTHLKRAANMEEFNEAEMLEWLDSDSQLERTVGLALFNAINSRVERVVSKEEAISTLNITSSDHVVMVGFFAPIVPKVKATGCQFDVLELNTEKPGFVDLHKGPDLLSECDVAIITATSIINNTVDDLLSRLSRNRAAVMLGPSTPVCPEVFKNSRITQLSGSRVMDVERVKRVISLGGGTKVMKKHLDFVSAAV